MVIKLTYLSHLTGLTLNLTTSFNSLHSSLLFTKYKLILTCYMTVYELSLSCTSVVIIYYFAASLNIVFQSAVDHQIMESAL